MNNQTNNGTMSYTKATVDIYFTGDTVCCERCPLLETYARKQCRRTGEYLVDTRYRGYWCPLVIQDDRKENENETIQRV